VVKVWRRTETGEAPRRQGAATAHHEGTKHTKVTKDSRTKKVFVIFVTFVAS
jgi:hypothetical protein